MAEWAQLLAGPLPRDPLERGRWYSVIDRLNTGLLKLSGPDAAPVMIHADFVRLTEREPAKITRVQATGLLRKDPGQPTPMMTFYGVCPKGHRLNRLSITDIEKQCSECGRTYLIEDEHHI
jgi:hypothetical protein